MQYCAYLQKNITNQVLISANKNVRVFNNKDIKCCTSRIITAAQKVLFRFINDFAQSPSNQQAKLKSIKTYKQKCCMKCFLSIHLSYPSHTPISSFEGKSKFIVNLHLRNLTWFLFFFPFTTFNKGNAASKNL